MRSPADDMVKIGFAKCPVKRFSKIQSDSPNRLILAAVEDGGLQLEAMRHYEFREYRRRGEWFSDAGALKEHIDALPAFTHGPRRKVKLSGPLGRWIVANGHTLESFAALVGTTQGTLSRTCNGKNMPRRDLIIAIIEATNWEVDANGILQIERPS